MKVDLRDFRLNVKGLSIEQLAAAMDVSPDVIRNLEATGNRPRPGNAIKVATYFEMTPDELWPMDRDSETSEAAA